MEAVKGAAEGKVLLRNLSWETYERIVAEREDRRVPRLYYDRGVLEIVSPSTRHETLSQVIALLIELLAAELDLDVQSTGSTTFKREDLERGFEPDQSFYFSHDVELVRDKQNIDLDAGDPPPKLVVEVDLSNPSPSKLSIYARIGVAEVWRYAGGKPEILILDEAGTGYTKSEASRTLPPLTSDVLARLVEEGLEMRRPNWMRRVRQWARQALEQ